MQHFNQTIVGITIILLLGALVAAKRLATGTIFDQPRGSFLVKFVNSFNLCFLLAVNPLAGVLLTIHRVEIINATRIPINTDWLSKTVEMVGSVFYVSGFALMAWALIRLGDNYQLGGSAPRPKDRLITNGPFRWVRHPMYTAALCISLGLTGLLPSWFFFGVFCIYLVLILLLIPMEEDGLVKAYGDSYGTYRKSTKKLVPLVY